MVAIDCSTGASLGEPTLTRNGVWMNEGRPRSAQPAVNAASCRGSPALALQPRGLPTNPCTARAPSAPAQARPPLASRPLIWMCAPIGGSTELGSITERRSPAERGQDGHRAADVDGLPGRGRLPEHPVAEEGRDLHLQPGLGEDLGRLVLVLAHHV